MTLLFSELTSIPNVPAVLSSLVETFWSSASLPPIRSMSSAKHRLYSDRPPMVMEVVDSLLHDVLQIDVEHNWREEANLANSN